MVKGNPIGITLAARRRSDPSRSKLGQSFMGAFLHRRPDGGCLPPGIAS